MHSITLSFATLTELKLVVAAVERAFAGAGVDSAAQVEQAQAAPAPAPAAGKPRAAKPAASPAPAAAASAPAPAASAPAASAPKADAPAEVDYPTLQKAVFTLAGMVGGRDAASQLLEQFEVKTFKDLASARWADALVAVNAKIDEIKVAA